MTTAALAVALWLASPAASAVKNPGTFVYLDSSDYETLDPDWSFETAAHAVFSNLYDYLLQYRPGGLNEADLQPMLSEAVPTRANGLITADGLTYRFPIRKGVRFHDGSEMTAEDVRYSLLRFMLLDRDAGPSSLLLQPVLGVNDARKGREPDNDVFERAARAVTVEGSTVVVRLARPFAPFLSILAGNGAVLSRALCAARGQWDGSPGTWRRFHNPPVQSALLDQDVGTGPFKLVRWDKKIRQLTLARHDAYWRGPAKIERVIIKAVPEFSTRKLMLLAGDADAVAAEQPQRSQLSDLPGVELIDVPLPLSPTTLFFVLSISTAGNSDAGSGRLDGRGVPADFFTDLDVRLGFAHALDYDAYARDVLRGRGEVPSSYMPRLLGGRAGAPAHPYDPAAASAHFRKAWGGEVWRRGFELTLSYIEGSDQIQAACQLVKRGIETLNPKFHVNVRVVQRSTSADLARKHNMPLIIGSWRADYPDRHNVAYAFMHSGGYYASQQSWRAPEPDDLVEKGAAELDAAARDALYARLQALADEQAPHVPFASIPRFRVQRTWIKGYLPRSDFPSPGMGYFYDLSKAE